MLVEFGPDPEASRSSPRTRAAWKVAVCNAAFIAGLSLALALPGCSDRSPSALPAQAGDFARFFVHQASGCGAALRDTNAPPTIQAHWRMEHAPDGFRVLVMGQAQTNIVSFLEQIIGPPHAGVGRRGTRYWSEPTFAIECSLAERGVRVSYWRKYGPAQSRWFMTNTPAPTKAAARR